MVTVVSQPVLRSAEWQRYRKIEGGGTKTQKELQGVEGERKHSVRHKIMPRIAGVAAAYRQNGAPSGASHQWRLDAPRKLQAIQFFLSRGFICEHASICFMLGVFGAWARRGAAWGIALSRAWRSGWCSTTPAPGRTGNAACRWRPTCRPRRRAAAPRPGAGRTQTATAPWARPGG